MFKVEKKHIKILIGFILVACALAAVVALISVLDKSEVSSSSSDVLTVDGVDYTYKRNIETLLLIGLDDFGESKVVDAYYNLEQADYLLLFVFDKDAETVSAISINRDTMTENPVLGINNARAGHAYEQIALSHTYGEGGKISCQNTVESVSDLLNGIIIDHYVSVTMDAVPILNDAIGGVTVTIPSDLTALDSAFVEGATVTLKGTQSLAFVRARTGVSDGTNISRMSRQEVYVNAFIDKAREKASSEAIGSDKVIDLLDEMSEYMVSDCSVERLDSLYDLALSYEFLGITSLAGTANYDNEYVEFYVADDALEDLVLSTFYDKD